MYIRMVHRQVGLLESLRPFPFIDLFIIRARDTACLQVSMYVYMHEFVGVYVGVDIKELLLMYTD